MIKRSSVVLFLVILLSLFSLNDLNAQMERQMNSSEILQAMNKLNTVGSVLYIAAHPDDENTRLLSYLASERKLRTGYLSLTRGDGGQNLIGKEQSELLGLIRTQELLAARRIDGAEQFFTRANDFGYSKNPEETLNFWGKDSILADVVWAIRVFKPDVMIMRFPTTGEGGHGHHTASAILAVEAFDAAANPNMFPEQLKYVSTWQAKRLFWNTFNFGGNNTTGPDQLTVDIGAFNPLLGKSYGEIASESRSMHKSQGFGSARLRGSSIEYFKFIKGENSSTDIMEGVDVSWQRINGTTEIQNLINECIKNYDASSPEKSVTALVRIYREITALNAPDPLSAYWKSQKLKETEKLIIACSGLWLEANASAYSCVPGEVLPITTEVIIRNPGNIKLERIRYLGTTDTIADLTLGENQLYKIGHNLEVPSYVKYSNPYWLNEKQSTGLFKVSDQFLVGTPENTGEIFLIYDLEIEGSVISIKRPVGYKYTDPVKGEVYRPLEILPPVTINASEKVYVFGDVERPLKEITIGVKANTTGVRGTVEASVTNGWKVTITNPGFNLVNKGDEAIINAKVIPEPGSQGGTIGTLELYVNTGGEKHNKSIKRIEYEHIPYQFILSDAEVKLVKLDLVRNKKNIGYIPGAGDDVPASLKEIGYDVVMLSDELLSREDLSKYDAIVSGIRAYNTNERLQVHYEKLMNYVKEGGNLIVQYNTNNRIGPIVAKMGPYPFNITRERVTDENAEVRFIKPGHKLLREPNKITSADFDGWIQERGIYFANELDPKFEQVLSMNDPNEPPKEGSLITAKYGKGNFVYTGLAFFRELPAGVPGAYRLFVNLLEQ
jgi:LmbE family N-acetylglucosaminyl deacetylase